MFMLRCFVGWRWRRGLPGLFDRIAATYLAWKLLRLRARIRRLETGEPEDPARQYGAELDAELQALGVDT